MIQTKKDHKVKCIYEDDKLTILYHWYEIEKIKLDKLNLKKSLYHLTLVH